MASGLAQAQAPVRAPISIMAPEVLVQKQLDAYNARDMEAFLATYADNAELFDFPAVPRTSGKEAMRKRYQTRFADTTLHAVIAKRIVMGDTVIDHERIQLTLPEGPGVMEAVAIYEVNGNQIAKVTFIRGKVTPGAKL
jgi:uncharacterized protein (TIGR02246 family)